MKYSEFLNGYKRLGDAFGRKEVSEARVQAIYRRYGRLSVAAWSDAVDELLCESMYPSAARMSEACHLADLRHPSELKLAEQESPVCSEIFSRFCGQAIYLWTIGMSVGEIADWLEAQQLFCVEPLDEMVRAVRGLRPFRPGGPFADVLRASIPPEKADEEVFSRLTIFPPMKERDDGPGTYPEEEIPAVESPLEA
jgi:hypothetical protein